LKSRTVIKLLDEIFTFCVPKVETVGYLEIMGYKPFEQIEPFKPFEQQNPTTIQP
jgi:hypothetical protein